MYALYLAKQSYMPRDQDFYHCAWSKGYKIFYSLCEQAGLQPVFWNGEECLSKSYDIVFIDRADGLQIFNRFRDMLRFKKSFYWCETIDHSRGVDLVGFISTEYMKQSRKKNIFWCGNIANGEKIYSAREPSIFSMVFLGRVTKIIADKIKLVGKTHPDLVIYLMPITVPDEMGVERDFKFKDINEYSALQNYFNLDNLIILEPKAHSELNSYLESLAPTFGFVPSIYDLDYPKMQLPSSSKIFDYYAAGIKPVVEWNVPEFFMPFSNVFKKNINIKNIEYDKNEIIQYSNNKLYSNSRAINILRFIR